MEQKLSVFRNELKYLVDVLAAQKLEAEIQQFMMADVHNVEEGYRVKSLYFDTINNMDFFDKRNGEFTKKKVRLRTYKESSDFLKLECKEKVGALQHKTSLLVSRDEAAALINSEYEFLLFRNDKESCRLYIF